MRNNVYIKNIRLLLLLSTNWLIDQNAKWLYMAFLKPSIWKIVPLSFNEKQG